MGGMAICHSLVGWPLAFDGHGTMASKRNNNNSNNNNNNNKGFVTTALVRGRRNARSRFVESRGFSTHKSRLGGTDFATGGGIVKAATMDASVAPENTND
mmetsp:Transcript_27327/g.63176  ORF Transcript_27327/g.63176 Transcript_27327/m.63176 type:complete len:100 (+) Transcript_27327:494-793(+)